MHERRLLGRPSEHLITTVNERERERDGLRHSEESRMLLCSSPHHTSCQVRTHTLSALPSCYVLLQLALASSPCVYTPLPSFTPWQSQERERPFMYLVCVAHHNFFLSSITKLSRTITCLKKLKIHKKFVMFPSFNNGFQTSTTKNEQCPAQL